MESGRDSVGVAVVRFKDDFRDGMVGEDAKSTFKWSGEEALTLMAVSGAAAAAGGAASLTSGNKGDDASTSTAITAALDSVRATHCSYG